ncbi:MAG: hypothetical protein HRU11_02815 [Parvularculaceae bacterium]|nr:hypothetical protein [Parvularculaceae bacterium]
MNNLAVANAQPPQILLNNAQKAAIILSLLDGDQARQLATSFDQGRTERAINAFEQLPMVDRSTLMDVIQTYLDALSGEVPLVAGGPRRANALADMLTSPPQLTNDNEPEVEQDPGSIDEDADADAVWAYVRALPQEKIARLVADERPAIISAVINQLDADRSSAVLAALHEEKASAVVRQMLSGREPTSKTYDAIAESLRRVAPGRLSSSEKKSFDPLAIANIFNRMPARRQSEILDPLKPEIPEQVDAVSEFLLSFPSLPDRLPRTIVPTVFRELDNKLIDNALGFAFVDQPDTAEFLLGSISQRLAEQIRERIEEQPKPNAADGEEAQAEIMRILIEWSEEGRFQFKFPDPDQAE